MDTHTRLKLETALIAHDKRQQRSKTYNRYALPQYLGALQRVATEADGGLTIEQALRNNFCDRLLDRLLKAIGVNP